MKSKHEVVIKMQDEDSKWVDDETLEEDDRYPSYEDQVRDQYNSTRGV